MKVNLLYGRAPQQKTMTVEEVIKAVIDHEADHPDQLRALHQKIDCLAGIVGRYMEWASAGLRDQQLADIISPWGIQLADKQ